VGASVKPREISGPFALMASCALLVCRLGAIQSARAAMTATTATPTALHLNFCARAIPIRIQYSVKPLLQIRTWS
jgi:hypothetical protein